ncbi:MAG: hypothetical protein V3U75_06140 [Methylococcaceae bacterium]
MAISLHNMANFNELSIVIPVGSGDSYWYQLVNQLDIFGNEVEIILAACQCCPADINLPENVQWLQSTQGRAKQLNAGARKVLRRFIWFLHADTRLTSEVSEAVQTFIDTDARSMGYFRLKFSCDGPGQTQLNGWAANIRSRYFDLPFGDQGFVMNRTIFDQLNGFDESVVVGEDLDFVVRLKAADILLQELPAELLTSARRYQQNGWFVTTVRHLWLTWYLTYQAKRRVVLG